VISVKGREKGNREGKKKRMHGGGGYKTDFSIQKLTF